MQDGWKLIHVSTKAPSFHAVIKVNPWWPFVRGIQRSPVNSPHKGPVTRSFDVFFDLRPNKRLSKQWRGWWFETQSCPLGRHCNQSDSCPAGLIWQCLALHWYKLDVRIFLCHLSQHILGLWWNPRWENWLLVLYFEKILSRIGRVILYSARIIGQNSVMYLWMVSLGTRHGKHFNNSLAILSKALVGKSWYFMTFF